MTTTNPDTVPPRLTRIEKLMQDLERLAAKDRATLVAADLVTDTARDARQLILDLLGMGDLPVGESLYREFCKRADAKMAEQGDQPEGTADELRTAAMFTKRFLPDVWPATDQGQAPFGRVLVESLITAVEAHLAKDHA